MKNATCHCENFEWLQFEFATLFLNLQLRRHCKNDRSAFPEKDTHRAVYNKTPRKGTCVYTAFWVENQG